MKVPIWAEAHAEMRRDIIDKDVPTWEKVIGGSLQRKQPEKEDLDWDEDKCEPVESQSEEPKVVENPPVVEKTHMDTAEESTADAPPPENLVEVSVGPGSQDVVQIHAGNEDLD